MYVCLLSFLCVFFFFFFFKQKTAYEMRISDWSSDVCSSDLSNYPLKKMIGFALDAVTSFSTLPLRMTTYLGLMAGATGLATLSWVLVSYLLGNVMTGWTSIAGLVDRKSVV